jgi:CheY-like chemotaxis protein
MVTSQIKKQTDIKVLVVDDELIARIANKMILEELNYKVSLANDGLEALELIKENPFDLILLDINMPKMSGIELTKVIRSSEDVFKEILIIGVTAQKSKEIEVKAKEAGMNELFSKPLSQEFIKNLVAKCINKN